MKENSQCARKLTTAESKFLEQLIRDNEKLINAIMFKRLGAYYNALAEDAIGQLYLLACEKIDVLLTHECPKGWLIVSATFISKSIIRRYLRDKRNVPYDDILNTSSGQEIFEESVFHIWIKEGAVEKLLSSLTKRERQVYTKLYIEGKSPAVAAEELDVTLNLIYTTKRNLKRKIIKIIKTEYC